MDEIGVFRRLGVSARSAVTGLVAGVVGTGALAASFIVEWQHLSITRPSGSNDPGFSTILSTGFGNRLAQLPFADVYVIGALALLTMVGAAVARPDRARWLRFAATTLGVGLATLVMVMVYDGEALYPPLYISDESFDLHEQIAAGGYWALGALAALVVGVWLTADPTSAVVATPAAPAVPTPAPHSLPAPTPTAARVGYLDGLTVTSSEPIDVGSGTDVLRT